MLRHLITAGDLSGYGLVNAVTHYSQDVDDYDRATEFESLGGKLIELPAPEWKGWPKRSDPPRTLRRDGPMLVPGRSLTIDP